MKVSQKAVVCFFLLCLGLLGLGPKVEAGILTVSPVAFRPVDSVSDNERTWYAHETELYVLHSVDGPYFVAPVYLPNGAIVRKVTVYLTDNGTGPDDEVRVYLRRQNLMTGVVQTMTYVCNHSPALPHKPSRQTMTDTTISYRTINNGSYSYTVYVWFIFDCTDRVRFHGVKIEY